jgi:tetratricopeptide (TPR) repeat protein
VKLRIPWILVIFSLFPGIASGQSPGTTTYEIRAFDQGIEEFRAGDYNAALQSFLDARQAGLDTPGLRYNTGVTYYRLERYPEAEQEFEALARDPEWSALAHYNLGLIAQRSGRALQAMEHYERAQRTSAEPNLRALAATALERLGRALPPTYVWVSLGGGYDSNATLSSDAGTLGISGKDDFLVEAFSAATRQLTGNTARGLVADGGLILRKYRDLDQYDLIGSRAGLSDRADAGRQQTSVGGYFDLTYVGGERLELDAVVDTQVRRRLDSGGDLGARYQLGHIDGGSAYEYLDGWQHRLTVDTSITPAPVLLRVGYQFEYSDRKDLQQGPDFSSYSPTRHMLFATAAWPSVNGWRANARGEFQASRYHDPNRLDGGTREITREDVSYSVFARATHRWTGAWRLFIDYSYYRNSSNLGAYDYNRHQLLAGTEAEF